MTNTQLTADVERLAFGGQGIVHHDNLVVFIPFTAPGDKVRYRITQQKKRFAYGELLEVLEPSKQRTLPKCPYFGTCGGCQLQHLDYTTQLASKRQSIEDALMRQAKLTGIEVPEVVAAKQQWAYRRKISLTLKPVDGFYSVGYIGVDQSRLIEVEQCPIFKAPEDPIFHEVRAVASTLISSTPSDAKLTLLKKDDGTCLLHFHFKVMPKNAETILSSAYKKHESWTAILATSAKETLQYGKLEMHQEISDLKFSISPKAFIQNHPEQSVNIYQSLFKRVKALEPNNVLDLYCGIGILSLMVAKLGITVTGVENNKEAVHLAGVNAQQNHIKTVNFVRADVERVLPELLQQTRPDLVILNPPREGLDSEVVKALIKDAPRYLIYVSCMPPTLARDLKLLCEKTYRVTAVEAYDMFPQTSHVETLVFCERSDLSTTKST